MQDCNFYPLWQDDRSTDCCVSTTALHENLRSEVHFRLCDKLTHATKGPSLDLSCQVSELPKELLDNEALPPVRPDTSKTEQPEPSNEMFMPPLPTFWHKGPSSRLSTANVSVSSRKVADDNPAWHKTQLDSKKSTNHAVAAPASNAAETGSLSINHGSNNMLARVPTAQRTRTYSSQISTQSHNGVAEEDSHTHAADTMREAKPTEETQAMQTEGPANPLGDAQKDSNPQSSPGPDQANRDSPSKEKTGAEATNLGLDSPPVPDSAGRLASISDRPKASEKANERLARWRSMRATPAITPDTPQSEPEADAIQLPERQARVLGEGALESSGLDLSDHDKDAEGLLNASRSTAEIQTAETNEESKPAAEYGSELEPPAAEESLEDLEAM